MERSASGEVEWQKRPRVQWAPTRVCSSCPASRQRAEQGRAAGSLLLMVGLFRLFASSAGSFGGVCLLGVCPFHAGCVTLGVQLLMESL